MWEDIMQAFTAWYSEVPFSARNLILSALSVFSHHIQEPVLSAEDVERLSNRANSRKPLSILKKVRKWSMTGSFAAAFLRNDINIISSQAQRHTIYCLLSCVSTVTSLCPHREEAVLLRLMRTLTRVRKSTFKCCFTLFQSNSTAVFLYLKTAPTGGYDKPCNFDEGPESKFERNLPHLQIPHSGL